MNTLASRVALVLTLVCASDVVGQPRGPSIDEIENAWKAREERAKAFRYRWVETTTRTKGSMSVGLPPAVTGGKVIPPEDATYDVPKEFSVSGEKMRYSYEGKGFSPEKNSLVPEKQLFTFDGRVAKLLAYPATVDYPSGGLFPDQKRFFTTNIHLAPLLMAHRGTHSNMRLYNLEEMVLTGGQALIGGCVCIELQSKIASSRTSKNVWVDPSKDYLIVRAIHTENDKPLWKVEITYKQDANHGWMPRQWGIVFSHSNGKLRESHRATVKDYSLNPEIPDEQFDIEFPKGTMVTDTTVSPSVNWVVKDGEKKREVLRSEIGATYEQLMATETGELSRDRPKATTWLWLGRALLGLLMVVGVTLVGAKYFHSRKNTRPTD